MYDRHNPTDTEIARQIVSTVDPYNDIFIEADGIRFVNERFISFNEIETWKAKNIPGYISNERMKEMTRCA